MPFRFRHMDEASARNILSWQYAPPYDYYNPDPSKIDEELQNYLNPENAYCSVQDEEQNLIGYCCFGKEGQVPGGDYSADALDIGLGLHPDLTGKGYGQKFLKAILDFALRTYGPNAFRVTVAEFNKRAIRLYENVGFKTVTRFSSSIDGTPFLLMIRKA